MSAETRTKTDVKGLRSAGFAYAEAWTFRGRPMERYRTMRTYPWKYRWLDVFEPNGLGSPMSTAEIEDFKKARATKVGPR